MNSKIFTESTLVQHLLELKTRFYYVVVFFITSFSISYFFVESICRFLIEPLADNWTNNSKQMIYTNLTEVFTTYLNVAFYVALSSTIPFMLCQLYFFIAPGLYKKEKRSLIPFLFLTPILFIAGATFVYYFIFPLAWHFFIGFENSSNFPINIKLEAKINEYIALVLGMMTAFGIAFQTPILLLFLNKIGVITPDFLRKKRKYAIILIFIVAAIITPPDATTQIALAFPMILLYEITILVSDRLIRKV